MGFGKAKYDVEEKGLDPRVGHKTIAADGRLEASQQVVTLTREEAEQKYLDMANKLADLEPKNGVFVVPGLVEEASEEAPELTLPVVSTEPVDVSNLEELQAAKTVWTEAAHEEVIKQLETVTEKEEPEPTTVTPKKVPAKKKTTKK